MRASQGHDKPALLMLSHCLPDPGGHADRARAWQLLRLAGQTHRVFLACLGDGPVHFGQWRAANGCAARTVLEPTRPVQRWLAGLAGLGHQAAARRRLMTRPLRSALQAWVTDQEFEAVLCTHPALCELARGVPARQRVLDLCAPASQLHHHLSLVCAPGFRWWHRLQARLLRAMEQDAAADCDAVTVASAAAVSPFAAYSRHTVVLPEGLDLAFFGGRTEPREEAAPASPHLVFHADWRHRLPERARQWFRSRIWPEVARAVPQARLVSTDAGPLDDPLAPLRRATVVVSPLPEPELTRWPLLQAMALRRPVIAAAQAVDDLHPEHGNHMLLCQNDRQWVESCVESLRSASFRLHLARGARAFVERHCPLERTGRALIDSLRATPAAPLAQAA